MVNSCMWAHVRAPPTRENRIVVMQLCLKRAMTLDVFSRKNLLQTSALARVVPTWVQGTESRLPKLGSKLPLHDV